MGRGYRSPYGAADGSLVLLHGITDSGLMWPDAVARWQSTFRIIAIDALGHGESDRWRDDELAAEDPIELMVAATVGAIESLDARVALVGHSMGGGVAAVIAARRPDLVKGALLEDPVWHPLHRDKDEARGAGWLAGTELARRDEAAAARALATERPFWSAAERRPAPWSMARADPRFLGLGRTEVTQPWQEVAGAVAVPTLVITGTDDVILNPVRRDEIAALNNASLEVVVIEGAGHCVRRDRPDAFHAIADAWLAALP